MGRVMPVTSVFLEGVLADGVAGYLAGDEHGRHGVHLGGGDAGDEVGSAGAGGAEGDADASGGACIAVGGVGGALLVAHEDVPELRVFGEVLVEGENSAAGDAEDNLHALTDEGFANYLSAAEHHFKVLQVLTNRTGKLPSKK